MSNQAISSSSSESLTTSSVRRHHTISAHSRSARAAAKDIISEETQEQQQGISNDDEVVGEDWVGGVGAVGEKTSLHRQASLPTRYHRGFQSQAAKSSNQNVNTLAAIESNDVDEEPWKIDSYNVDEDEHIGADAQTQSGTPLSPHFTNPSAMPSPPAASTVRRHVSLTYGAAGQQRKTTTGLRRAGTITNPLPPHSQQNPSPPDSLEQPEADDNAYEPEDLSLYQDEYLKQQQQQQPSNATLGTSSPWVSGNEWRPAHSTSGNGGTAIDDVQVALLSLELTSNGPVAHQGYPQYPQPPPLVQPPRFNTAHQQHQVTGSRGGYHHNGSRGSDYDGRKTPNSQRGGNVQHQYGQGDRSASWNQKEENLRGSASNPNLRYGYQQSAGHTKASSGSAVPSVPPIPPQYLQQQSNQINRQGLGIGSGFNDDPTPVQPILDTPIDVPSLVATKGYNPVQFDIRPPFARYFVIKSYTEDDVHKSLKYEIWSSTDPGNKRLDKAFKETAGRGPIYLFFSVNASGHFCGMAEMLTPVDYTRNSTVWASDKWKGVFKVRWIFVRDIPNMTLRHIKLMNTQEKKPVTNSRDTQELLPDAGQEMLRIFYTHPARTSLLQDFAFYELQAFQKAQGGGSPGSPQPPALSSPQLHSASIPNTNTGFSYNMPSVMGVGGSYSGATQSLHPQTHAAMHHSVMRHPSPNHQAQQQAMNAQGNYGLY